MFCFSDVLLSHPFLGRGGQVNGLVHHVTRFFSSNFWGLTCLLAFSHPLTKRETDFKWTVAKEMVGHGRAGETSQATKMIYMHESSPAPLGCCVGVYKSHPSLYIKNSNFLPLTFPIDRFHLTLSPQTKATTIRHKIYLPNLPYQTMSPIIKTALSLLFALR